MFYRRKLISALVLGSLGITVAKAKVASELNVPPHQELNITKEMLYPLIELSGTAFERGKAYGASAKEAIARNILFYSSVFKSSAGIDWEKAQERASRFLPVIEKYSPQAVEEMKGVAEGSGRTFTEILTLNCRSEIMFAGGDACTCIMIPSDMGKDGHVYMAQTWDWVSAVRGNSVVLKVHQEGLPSILMICEAGLIGGKGVNSEGVSIGLNAVSAGYGKVGMPLHLMMRNVLNSGLPTEALRAVSMVPRAGSGIFNIATKSDFEMIVEFSPDNFDVLMSKGEPMVHTNHYLSPLLAVKDVTKSFIPSTFTRLNTVEKLLKKDKTPIGVKELFNLLSNHDNYPESVCYHEDPRLSGDRYCSVYGMVIDVTSGSMFISRENPCEGTVAECQL